MTITVRPIDASGGEPTYTAQQVRQSRAASYGAGSGRPLGGRSGFRLGTGDILTATSTAWTLQACAAHIDPGATLYQGVYEWATDDVLTGQVDPANAVNPRKDILYIQVNDASAGDGSGARSAPVEYLAGAPAATPVAPVLPPRSMLVGTITVPQEGAGSPSVMLTPARVTSAGGILPVTEAERDALSPYPGMAVFVDGQLQIHDGNTWNAPNGAPYGMYLSMLRNTAGSVANATWTTVAFWQTVSGSMPYGGPESGIGYSNGKVTIPKTGLWHLWLTMAFDTNGTGRMAVRFNTAVIAPPTSGGAYMPYGTQTVDAVVPVQAGTELEVQVFQNTGVTQRLYADGAYHRLGVRYLGPA